MHKKILFMSTVMYYFIKENQFLHAVLKYGMFSQKQEWDEILNE